MNWHCDCVLVSLADIEPIQEAPVTPFSGRLSAVIPGREPD